MKSYTQLTSEQRYQIYALLKKNHTQTDIAQIIGVHKSTVSRELKRNTESRGYRPKQAHNKALERRDEKVWFGVSESTCLLYTSPSPRDLSTSRMPSSA